MNKYNQLKIFNITKVTKDVYEKYNTTESLDLLLSNIDYAETSRKEFIIYHKDEDFNYPHHNNYVVEETLAENFIDSLPFNAYKKYITSDWLSIKDKNNENPLVRKALSSENFELLNALCKLGFEDCMREKSYSFFLDYKIKYLNKILDIESVIVKEVKSKDFFNDYYDLFKELLLHNKVIREKHSEKDGIALQVKTEFWLFSLSKDKNKVNNKSDIGEALDFIYNLASNREAVKIIDDVMWQLKEFQKSNNDKSLLKEIKDSEIIENALSVNNQYFIDKLQVALSISDKVILSKVNSFLENALEKGNKETFFKNSYIKKLKSKNINDFILEKSKSTFDIKSINKLGMLILSDNEEILSLVKKNLDLNSFLIDVNDTKITYKDSIAISYVMNAYINDNFKKGKLKNLPLLLDLGNKLIKEGYEPDLESYPNLFDNLKNNIIPLLIDFYCQGNPNHLTIPENSDKWLTNFLLNEVLVDKSSLSSPRVKI